MDVGNQIKYYRKENNLSQAELAEKIFVSNQTISNWENERSYPDLHNLIELTTLFNVSLDQLVKGDVKAMRNAIDHSNMNRYGNLMILFILLSAVSFGAALKFSDGWFGFLVPLLLWMISFYFANKLERLKKKYDVQTYKEILDYMEHGKKSNDNSRNKKKFIIEQIIIVSCFTAVFGILVLISIFLFQLL
ncbi:helix-turn-helix domain-containing protein [Staphylococcus felis]|uniref:helix-turn-helix domain-containing protein n=1 Tax=Staphylococcus felis TaxID=46127 RepID=UPI0021D10C62|nr:helix-turn-helix transcriptional regulator [Staphylococcus felis]UXR86791.1 helix-turn-helix domain-containing protein [Staphylococcus felis]